MPLLLTFTSLFPSYATDDTHGDYMEDVLIRQKSVLCTFVKGTASKEWKYGLTLEAVRHDVRMACVLLEGGVIVCYSRNELHKAATRMQDTSKQAGKAWEPSVYFTQYKGKVVSDLERVGLFLQTSRGTNGIVGDSEGSFHCGTPS